MNEKLYIKLKYPRFNLAEQGREPATRVTHILCRLQDTTSRSKCTTLALSKMRGPENTFVIPPKISQLKRVLKLNENV